jgi:Co/Zn/Cd efflux system component
MSGQCRQNQPKFDGVSTGFKRALWLVIAINGVMFFVEMIAGRISGSQALQSDALDFFADTITYGLSLYVIGMSIKTRSSIALLKGFSLAGSGVWVTNSAWPDLVVASLMAGLFFWSAVQIIRLSYEEFR